MSVSFKIIFQNYYHIEKELESIQQRNEKKKIRDS